jgi:HEAT repeat protein
MKILAVIQKGRVFLLAGILVGLLCVIFHPLGPRYEGKPLSIWAADLLGPKLSWDTAPSPEALAKQDQAVIAIRHFGIQALPLALQWCGTEDSAFMEKFKDWFNEQKVFPAHLPSDYDYQKRGLKIFEVLGPTAKSAIPSLIELLQRKHSYTLSTVSCALTYTGPEAIPSLINELTNQSPQARTFAAITLGSFGAQAKAAEPGLLLCVKEKDYSMQNYAAIALAEIGAEPTNAVPALIAALEKETSDFNRFAPGVFYALGRFGTNAKPAVPLLVKIIESDQKPFWFSNPALRALDKIDPKTAQPFIEQRNTVFSNSIPAPASIQPTPVLLPSSPGSQTNSVSPPTQSK